MINRKFKKCLITGITGSGGSYLAEHILSKDSKIKIFGIYRSPGKKNLLKNTRIKLFKGDLCNFNKTQKIIKKINPDLIFHLASTTNVSESFNLPKKTIENNIRDFKLSGVALSPEKKEIYKRLKKRRNFNLKVAKKFKKLQLPIEVKKKQSDFIIKNNFNNNSIKKNVKRVLEKILLNA